MFRHIQAQGFLLCGDPQANTGLDDQEGDGDGHGSPRGNGKDAQELNPQKRKAAAIEQAYQRVIAGGGSGGKKAGGNSTPDAVEAVNSHSAHRIVNAQHIVQEPYAEHHQQTGNRANDQGAEAVRHIAGGRDGHQSRQGGVQAHGNIGLSITDPCKDHAYDGCCRGGNRSGQENGAQLFHTGGGGAVEAVPAQPEDDAAQAAQRQAVAGEGIDLDHFAVLILYILANAGAEKLCADESGDAAHHVDRAGAGKIMEAQLGKPTAAPNPVGFDGVNQSGDYSGVYAVREEFGALSHGPGYDRGCGCAENKIEYKVRPVEAFITGENIKTRLTDQSNKVFPEKQIKADQNKHDRTDAEVHQVLHQYIAGVFRPGKAGLHHGKAGLHPEHKGCANQKPNAEYR